MIDKHQNIPIGRYFFAGQELVSLWATPTLTHGELRFLLWMKPFSSPARLKPWVILSFLLIIC